MKEVPAKYIIQKEKTYFNYDTQEDFTFQVACNWCVHYGMNDGVLQPWQEEILVFVPFHGNLQGSGDKGMELDMKNIWVNSPHKRKWLGVWLTTH